MASWELIRALAGAEGGPRVSIYLPTRHRGGDYSEEVLRLRGLREQAEAQLEPSLGEKEARRLTEPLRELESDGPFWRVRDAALACFGSAGGWEWHDLPEECEELAVIGERFHLVPLLRPLQAAGLFHVLALSQNHVRLLRCSAGRVLPVDLGDAPTSRAEALELDDHERQLQSHTAEPASRAQVFHGHGMGGEWHESERQRFLARVAAGVDRVLAPDDVVVLATVEEEAAEFRQHSRVPQLLDAVVAGNPDRLSEDELCERARPLVLEHRHEVLRRALARLEAGKNDAAWGLEQVLKAAASGRVHELFIAEGESAWGSFDTRSFEVEVGVERESGSEELVNRALVETLRHGGDASVLPAADMDRVPVVAMLR